MNFSTCVPSDISSTASKKSLTHNSKADLESACRQNAKGDVDAIGGAESSDFVDNDMAEHGCNIVRVCQRVKVEVVYQVDTTQSNLEEIWALIEFEQIDPDDLHIDNFSPKRSKKWKRFEKEAELKDFIRRDTGEPLKLPPYSLTPHQSAKMQEEARKSVSKITEEFRRFRVKSEMARKQADAQIRELQTNNVESAKQRIEGQDVVRFHPSWHAISRLHPHDFVRRKKSSNRQDPNSLVLRK